MSYAIPAFIFLTVTYALFKKTSVYDNFSEGAKNGITTLFNIFPSLLAIMISVAMLRESGALDALMQLVSP